MNYGSCNVIIAAEAPDALTEVCGISILERLLRVLQRLNVASVTIVSATPDAIRDHLARPSWARADLRVEVRMRHAAIVTVDDLFEAADSRGSNRTLVLTAAYYDSRSLLALLTQTQTTLLVDSVPPPDVLPLLAHRASAIGYICTAAVMQPEWLSSVAPDQPVFEQLAAAAERHDIAVIDLATQPLYVTSMRRSIRPIWFPSPSAANLPLAQRLVLDTAQNGTLDLPAIVHAPIETWIVARLCRTSITPNQITLFAVCVSAVVVVLFASGRLISGASLALVVGVLDGLDGKQARVKVETTPLGNREHAFDYVLELLWWIALAFHFTSSGRSPNAYALLLLLVGSDLIDRLAKKHAKQKTGRNLDDVAPIDRFVRLIGGRRNIYTWILAAGLLLGAADKAFVALCCWGALTAAVHVWRAIWISGQHSVARTKSAPH